MPEEVAIYHITDEVDTKPETIIKDGEKIYWIHIHNTSSNTLLVSFDGGTNWKKIGADKTLEIKAPENMQIRLTEPLKMKGSGANTTFEILLMKERS